MPWSPDLLSGDKPLCRRFHSRLTLRSDPTPHTDDGRETASGPTQKDAEDFRENPSFDQDVRVKGEFYKRAG